MAVISTMLIDRIRAIVEDGTMSRSGLARAAGLHANSLRDLDSPGWNPTAASTSRIRPCSLAARAPSSQTVSTNLTSRPRPLLWLQSTQGLSPTVTYGKQTPGGGPSNTPLTALARGACARIAATAAA